MITFDDEPDAFRSGAQEDSRRLIEVLNTLNFRVYELNDPTAEVLTAGLQKRLACVGLRMRFHLNSCVKFIAIGSESEY